MCPRVAKSIAPPTPAQFILVQKDDYPKITWAFDLWQESIDSVGSKAKVEDYIDLMYHPNSMVFIDADLTACMLCVEYEEEPYKNTIELLIGGYIKGMDLNTPFKLLDRLLKYCSKVKTTGRKGWLRGGKKLGYDYIDNNDGTLTYFKDKEED